MSAAVRISNHEIRAAVRRRGASTAWRHDQARPAAATADAHPDFPFPWLDGIGLGGHHVAAWVEGWRSLDPAAHVTLMIGLDRAGRIVVSDVRGPRRQGEPDDRYRVEILYSGNDAMQACKAANRRLRAQDGVTRRRQKVTVREITNGVIQIREARAWRDAQMD